MPTPTGRLSYSAPAMQYIGQARAAEKSMQKLTDELASIIGVEVVGDEVIVPAISYAEVEARVAAWMKENKK